MEGMVRVALVSIAVASSLTACGGASSPPPPPPEEPGRCVVDPALAETRRAKPPESGCSSEGTWDALAAACNGGDPDACYQIAICVKLQEITADLSDAERAQHVAASVAGLRVACDAGIAEACNMRVGVQMYDGAPMPADGCADLVRGCQLGDERGCFDCQFNGCD